jgi:NhaP-type Na+/H+ or K+/H+ antiporter
MSEQQLLSIALVTILGVGATWIAARLRIPSILVLLIVGFCAGPVFHVLEPDRAFGDVLFPFVSLSVAVILFEGGLQLRVRNILETKRAVFGLVVLGSAVTFGLSAGMAYVLLDWTLPMSLLLASILVVTGPTVILPMLRNIRPAGRIGSIIRWEGIVNDPLGAILAFLVFGWIEAGQGVDALGLHLWRLVASVATGILMGLASAFLLRFLMRKNWIPDYLQNPFALMLVMAVFILSNHLFSESGLLAVTVMGIALANQQEYPIHYMVHFHEDLRVLLIAVLFIALSARIDLAVFSTLGWETLAFLALSVIVVRPVAVFLSTLGSSLNRNEKGLLAWMAPRGIVAAAVSSIFALRMAEMGIADAERLVPVVFMLIVGTVGLYGSTAGWLARRLGLATRENDGVLFVGAHALARELARTLKREGIKIVLVSNIRANVEEAQQQGLEVHYVNMLARRILEEVDLSGVGQMVALTASDEINALASLHFEDYFGRRRTFHTLPLVEEEVEVLPVSVKKQGQCLGHPALGHKALNQLLEDGFRVEKSVITTGASWSAAGGPEKQPAFSLFVLEPGRGLRVVTPETPVPKVGQQVINVVPDPGEKGQGTTP